MNETSSLAELVVAQHDKLKERHTKLVKSILEGDTNHNVMLLLDGYDEYKKGTNTAIDNAIESTIGNCFLILTSRPDGHVSEDVRMKMDGEIIIEGFSKENISKYSTKYLESEDESKTMLKQAVQSGIRDLLHVPIILLLVCLLFKQDSSLPATQTKLFHAVFHYGSGQISKQKP